MRLSESDCWASGVKASEDFTTTEQICTTITTHKIFFYYKYHVLKYDAPTEMLKSV